MFEFNNETCWQIIDNYYRDNEYYITKHGIDSYNNFINVSVPKLVKALNEQSIIKKENQGAYDFDIKVSVGGKNGDQFTFQPPIITNENGVTSILYPNQARLYNKTYQSNIVADILIEYTIYNNSTKEIKNEAKLFPNKIIGSVPIMLKSCICPLANKSSEFCISVGECPYDQGGYYIISGKEKVIVADERIATNKLFVNFVDDGTSIFQLKGLIRSITEEDPFPKSVNLYMYKDSHIEKRQAIRITIPKISLNPESTVSSEKNDLAIPIFIIFRALGIESDRQIIEYITGDPKAVEGTMDAKINSMLYFSLIDGNYILTQEQALEFLRQYTRFNSHQDVIYTLQNNLFPTISIYSFQQKALFLGYIIKQFIKTYLKVLPESNRDSYIYKRVDVSGFLTENLFRDIYNRFKNDYQVMIDAQYNKNQSVRQTGAIVNLINNGNFKDVFKPHKFHTLMNTSFKGDFGKILDYNDKIIKEGKKGLIQELSRLSDLSYVSYMRRARTPIDENMKSAPPHQIHGSHFGYFCPIDTPDGGNVGLIKHLAVLATVTIELPAKYIDNVLIDFGLIGLEKITSHDISTKMKIFVNNVLRGIHEDPLTLYNVLILLRRNAFINIYTSITIDYFEQSISILTDPGRITRPIMIVGDNNKMLINSFNYKNSMEWLRLVMGKSVLFNGQETLTLQNGEKINSLRQLEHKGYYINPYLYFKMNKLEDIIKKLQENQSVIEYVDSTEQENTVIALRIENLLDDSNKKAYTHIEIHPSVILSAISNNQTYGHHNPATRNLFYSAQTKQAVGLHISNYHNRIDTLSYVQYYPQKKLSTTRYMQYYNNHNLPHGQNLTMAMLSYSGYNQEDSVIINYSAIQRGAFNMTYYKGIVLNEESSQNGTSIRFANPQTLINNGIKLSLKSNVNYTHIDSDGLPIINTYMHSEDAFVGVVQISTIADLSNKTGDAIEQAYEDMSMVSENKYQGFIDKIIMFKNGMGDNDRTIKIRMRKQKLLDIGDKVGTTNAQKGTVGMILPEWDMPITKDGLIPDVVLNPHAIPTRMTMAQFLEMIGNQLTVMTGNHTDATFFDTVDMSAMQQALRNMDYNQDCSTVMYNGMTGEQIDADVFIAPAFYQRLKQFASDKINYRHRGTMVSKTRQPPQGKSNKGGMKIGNMETDAIISHGMFSFIKESFMERSDNYYVFVCKHTGKISEYNADIGYFNSPDKTSRNNTSHVRVNIPYSFKQFLQEMEQVGISTFIKVESYPDILQSDELYIDNDQIPELDIELAFNESDQKNKLETVDEIDE